MMTSKCMLMRRSILNSAIKVKTHPPVSRETRLSETSRDASVA
jgi:hypothetical protein